MANKMPRLSSTQVHNLSVAANKKSTTTYRPKTTGLGLAKNVRKGSVPRVKAVANHLAEARRDKGHAMQLKQRRLTGDKARSTAHLESATGHRKAATAHTNFQNQVGSMFKKAGIKRTTK